jgi:hypothetical protein
LCFCIELFLSGVVLSSRRIVASSSNDKGKKPMEEDYQDLKLRKNRWLEDQGQETLLL